MIADSVRLALPGEAAAIAAIQRRAWEQTLPGVATSLQRSITLAEMTDAWIAAIVKPPLAQHRVLVAVGDERIVGFAAVGPSGDPDAVASEDGQVAEFTIDPQAQRQGHGSRLLNAVADTLRTDGFRRASWWIPVSYTHLDVYKRQMSFSRSEMRCRPGRIRSTPGCESSGNRTPASTSRMRPSISKLVMLRPTSPQPPSGVTRRAVSYTHLDVYKRQVQTCMRTGVPFTTARTRWMFGSQRRLVFFFDQGTLCPKLGPLAQMSHTAATSELSLQSRNRPEGPMGIGSCLLYTSRCV